MGYRNSRGRSKKTSRKTPPKTVSMKATSEKSIKSIVKKEIAKNYNKVVEKKEFEFLCSGLPHVGQIATNSSGHVMHDITPILGTGPDNGERIGSTIRHTGMYINFQFTQDDNCQSAREGKIYILRAKSPPIASIAIPAAIAKFFKPNMHIYHNNSGVEVFDTSSQINYDYKNDFDIVKVKRFKLERDSYSSQATMKNVEIKLKLTKDNEIKFNGNTSTVTSGQLIMVIMLNAGNCNASGASTLVGTTTESKSINSGLLYTYYGISYYTDA